MRKRALALWLGFAILPPFGSTAIAQTFVDPAHTDIPERFRGLWALGSTKCTEERGPAFAEIGTRSIYFYEKYGALRLGQINYAPDEPTFFGKFDFAGGLDFWEQNIRIDPAPGGDITISLIQKSSDAVSTMRWHRCSD